MTASTVASSGAPRKMDGTMSRKLWEMVLATMAMAMYSAGTPDAARAGDMPSRMAEVLLTCTPGSSPAIAPIAMPPMSDASSRLKRQRKHTEYLFSKY